jgi:hypothetical protein
MPLTLTPEQERRVKTLAERKQKPVEVVLDELLPKEATTTQTKPKRTPAELAEYVAQLRAAQRPKNQGALDLLERWREEDAAMTEEEKEKADQDLNDLLAGLQANRTRIGDA